VSAAGQLSTGDPSDQRQQTSNSLADTEHKLNTIGRSLNDQEQKTSAHIREFIKEARAALNTGDVEGAKTLAQKAKVLLGELTK
jgi:ribosomal protein S20